METEVNSEYESGQVRKWVESNEKLFEKIRGYHMMVCCRKGSVLLEIPFDDAFMSKGLYDDIVG